MVDKSLVKNKYKESSTEETIGKIKNIIEGMGFELRENSKMSGAGTFWTRLNIYIDGVYINRSFGKGNTEDFSRASAYAEMIERIQSDYGYIFRAISSYYNKCETGAEDFIIFPDEVKIYDVDKYVNGDNEAKHILEYCEDSDEVKEKTFDIFKQLMTSIKNTYGFIPLAKYTNMSTGETELINEIYYRDIVLSDTTGYCAGNTKYEALLQGLCEVVERYVKYEIFWENMSLPIISEEYLSEYVKDSKRLIEYSGRYLLEVRDASLGKGLPVACAIVYDRGKRGYLVAFGAFPDMDIAVERAVNEIFQLQTLEDISYIVPMISMNYGYNGMTTDTPLGRVDMDNVKNLLNFGDANRNNTGQYPDKFFSYEFSYEFSPWQYSKDTNENMLNNLVSVVEDVLDTKVLYKDYSFLGFPTYSIICKGLAERLYSQMGKVYVTVDFDRECIEDFIFNGMEDPDSFVDAYERANKKADLFKLIARSLKYGKVSDNILKGYVEFIKGNYSTSAALLERHGISPLFIPESSKQELYESLECMSNVISMKGSLRDDESIRSVMYKLYRKSVVDNVINSCRDYKTLGRALFLDRNNPICMVDWDLHEKSRKAHGIIYNKKKEYGDKIGK